jgi:hypothetical protein
MAVYDSIPPLPTKIFQGLFLEQTRLAMMTAAELCGDLAKQLQREGRRDAAMGALECEELLDHWAEWVARQMIDKQEAMDAEEDPKSISED